MAMMSLAVNAKLICAFVFSYAEWQFSHDAAQLISPNVFFNIQYNVPFKIISAHMKWANH